MRRTPSISITLLFVLAACQTAYEDKPLPSDKEPNSLYERTAHIKFLKPLADSCKDKGKSGSVYADNLILWTDYPEYLETIGIIEEMTGKQKGGDWLVKQELAYDRGVCAVSLYQQDTRGLEVSQWDCKESSVPTVNFYPDERNIPSELFPTNAFECHSYFDHQQGMISFFGEVDNRQVSSHQLRK
ncbi:hypothetical protein DES40_0437 [Litorimonas taeanensis]|uniref:Lipoprotein n=1 Tax=Litorimonas taeanensis TaxID=568099 RepID=A0A420WJM6_9PROT|nr:hypothetical protein [Litorimonas taeanensis]RKQ71126.1 hypothetical protein DES40_0437 [Litorimonas taeanensis]